MRRLRNAWKRIHSRPERGLYLAVIGLLTLCLLAVMGANRQMRSEMRSEMRSLAQQQAIDRKLAVVQEGAALRQLAEAQAMAAWAARAAAAVGTSVEGKAKRHPIEILGQKAKYK